MSGTPSRCEQAHLGVPVQGPRHCQRMQTGSLAAVPTGDTAWLCHPLSGDSTGRSRHLEPAADD